MIYIKNIKQNNVIGQGQLVVGMVVNVKHFPAWKEKASLKKMSHKPRAGRQGASREYEGEDDSSPDAGEAFVFEQQGEGPITGTDREEGEIGRD